MKDYSKFKVRTPTLDRLYQALRTIQATSVAPERNFSDAENVVTKKRTLLSDGAIDGLIFLKHYFRNLKKLFNGNINVNQIL